MLWETLNDWYYLYWVNSSYRSGESWRQKEFSKLVIEDKNGKSYY